MSFLEGFSRSLGNSLIEEDRAAKAAQRDRKEWEFRQQKLAEMEERLIKSRIAKVEKYEEGGRVMAQPVNAYGEPIGVARPASEAEAREFTEGRDDRKRDVESKELGLRSARAGADVAERDLANYDSDRDLRKRESESGIAARLASAESARASADLSRANAEFLRNNDKLPGRDGSGRQGKTIDAQSYVELVELAAESGVSEQIVREAVQKYQGNYQQVLSAILAAAGVPGTDQHQQPTSRDMGAGIWNML